MKTLKDMIGDVRSDRDKGASELALLALGVVRSAVLSCKASDAKSFLEEISNVLDELAVCRPSMAIIGNCMRGLSENLEVMKQSNDISTEEMKGRMETILDKIEEDIRTAKLRSISNAVAFINDCYVIATCSCSSTLVEIFKTAHREGKKIELRILRSTSGGINYGEITASKLMEIGVDCRVYDDFVSVDFLDGTDIVMLGSDTVFKDGSVLNGYPSLRLSKLAAEHRPSVPVYVVSDSSKISPDRSEKSCEPGFDLVPGSLIEGFITEKGLCKR
jgi:translation initiation factor eIF-2B subunit delta